MRVGTLHNQLNPAESSDVEEVCYVLEGEVLVGNHLMRAGDFHIARTGGRHPDLISPRGGAPVMIRSQAY